MDTISLEKLIREYLSDQSIDNFTILQKYVLSGEFRDEEFNSATYDSTFSLLDSTLGFSVSDDLSWSHLVVVRKLCVSVVECVEFIPPNVPVDVINRIVVQVNPSRINKDHALEECEFVQSVLLMLYEKSCTIRISIRHEIGRFLFEFAQIPTRTSFLTPILTVLNSILRGIECKSSSSVNRLFKQVLLPLHLPNGWSFWDRQTPILAEYHQSLLLCCAGISDTELIEYILDHCFPPVGQTNTPKELLLLFEISKLISPSISGKTILKLGRKLAELASSENAQIVQSALIFWKDPNPFSNLLKPHLPVLMPELATALVRPEPHWNPTVNKMILLTLKSLQDAEPELFHSCVRSVFADKLSLKPTSLPAVEVTPIANFAAIQADTTQPPLGITGVAPPRLIGEPQSPGTPLHPPTPQFIEYQNSLRVSESPSVSSWETALSCESPTLLPDLKFHNLVFGRDLGTGSFSTVRYARVIQKGMYLSQWPEVAVKHVSFETISAHNYWPNVAREIACLRKLAHPAIARLMSSFQWRDGVYLVLEFGALGDLHTYIRSAGPLSEFSAQICVGEISAAVQIVHESGYVYGDLKPENIVITSARHLKLADFGAARPRKNIEDLLQISDLRSGDWKDTSEDAPVCSEAGQCVEGTIMYMAPEGGEASLLSDAWALGLTSYFLIKGRLPPWVGENGYVHDKNLQPQIFSDLSEQLVIGSEGSEFLKKLLVCDPGERTPVCEIITHTWLSQFDVRNLYKVPVPEDHLAEAPNRPLAAPSQWEKRQLSKIWSAQPTDYSIHTPAKKFIKETTVERDALFI